MAIFHCPECGNQVGSEVETCPSCGQMLQLKAKKSGCGIFGLVLAAILAVALLGGLAGRNESPKITSLIEIPKVGDVWFVGNGALGCLQRKDLERMAELSRQGDRDAVANMVFEMISVHACRVLQVNSTLYVESVESSGFVCGRPRSETKCLWVHAIEISERMFSAAPK
jgi:hypothetical protein